GKVLSKLWRETSPIRSGHHVGLGTIHMSSQLLLMHCASAPGISRSKAACVLSSCGHLDEEVSFVGKNGDSRLAGNLRNCLLLVLGYRQVERHPTINGLPELIPLDSLHTSC